MDRVPNTDLQNLEQVDIWVLLQTSKTWRRFGYGSPFGPPKPGEGLNKVPPTDLLNLQSVRGRFKVNHP